MNFRVILCIDYINYHEFNYQINQIDKLNKSIKCIGKIQVNTKTVF